MKREQLDARAARGDESGFTLIELMMVVLIIAILIAVLIPVLSGASARAKDRATQSSLHNALTAAKTVFADKADYTAANAGTMQAAAGAGSVTFVAGSTDPHGQNTISVEAVTPDYILLGGESKAGHCFFVADDATGGTTFATMGSTGGCRAEFAPGVGDPSWKSAW
jgi:type IV pilus assembly protein PilA